MSTYKILGMTCEGCVRSVTKALEAALPSATVEVSLQSGAATVTGEHDSKAAKDAITDAGFDLDDMDA